MNLIKNAIVISDIHCGCQYGLFNPKSKIKLDGGGIYEPSNNQKKMWEHWEEFWNVWVPQVTRKDPYIIIFNGDAIDGNHHGSNTQITSNYTI